MPGCCITNCKNSNAKGFRLFHLPRGEKNSDRRRIWLEFINRKNVSLRASVCEVHFDISQFETKREDGRKLLKWNAIPGPVPEATSSNLNSFLDNCSVNPKRKRNVSQITDLNSHIGNSSNSHPHKKKRNADYVDDNCIFVVKENYLNNVHIEHLENKLKYAQEKINDLESRMKRFEAMYLQMFNPDQILFIQSGGSLRGIEWSDETIKKSLRLYNVCGPKGYKELKNQNLPFPSVGTLQHRIKDMKVKPELGLSEGAFSLPNLRVASVEHLKKEASIIVIDEVAEQSEVS